MKVPLYTPKMEQDLRLDEWRKENLKLREEFGLSGNHLRREVDFDTIAALVSDALEYRKIFNIDIED